MLYSRAQRLAFAHYPKTAGSAISVWFRRTFPDAVEVRPGIPHLDVSRALAGLGRGGVHPLFVRGVIPWSGSESASGADPAEARQVRIVGVVRSPFEMLVSLFEYWRRLDAHPAPGHRLITTARTGTFRQFVSLATRGRRLPRYRTFFDAGGPAWHRTRLVHFDAVEAGLQRVLDEFGIDARVELEGRNRAPSDRPPLSEYEAQAGPLVMEVHRRFLWYHRNQATFVRGSANAAPLRRAA